MDPDHFLESQMVNLPFLEEIYQLYQSAPEKIDRSWIPFFQKLEKERRVTPSLLKEQPSSQVERITHLIEAYRQSGHLLSKINPIALEEPHLPDQLKLENLGFQPHEEEEIFPTLHLLPQPEAPLKTIVDVLKRHYSQSVGFEFKGLSDLTLENWIQEQIESGRFEKALSLEDQLFILDVLTRAEVLETFLHTKHVGKKRFSLEGAENSYSDAIFDDCKVC